MSLRLQGSPGGFCFRDSAPLVYGGEFLKGNTRMTRVREAVWHFHCPKCGFGDREFGYLLADEEVYCTVCLEEEGTTVTLRRWLTQPTGQARLREAREAA